jgi:hypothetical protein
VLIRSVSLVDTSSLPPHQICSYPWGPCHHPSCNHPSFNDLPNQVAVHHLLCGDLARSLEVHQNHHPFSRHPQEQPASWVPSADFAANRQAHLERLRREKIRREKRLKNWDIKSSNIISFNYQSGVPISCHRRLVRDSTRCFSHFVPKNCHP